MRPAEGEPPVSAFPHQPPRPSPKPARKASIIRRLIPKWGWLEWFVIAQTALPALMFIPGLSVIRTPSRVAAFSIALVAWAWIALVGSRPRPGAGFPSTPWLFGVIGWLCLLIFHPDGNTMLARVGHVALYTAILCPAFWAGAALKDTLQIGRLLKIMFVCNALGAAVGVGQVFRPEIFNPPVIPQVIKAGVDRIGDVSYVDSTGRRIIRPCGLTDQVGGGAQAGMAAALLGMGLLLKGKLSWIWRVLAVGAAFAGVAVIYYSQVRMTLAMLAVALALLTILFLLQRDYRRAGLLGFAGSVLILGSFAWVVSNSGTEVFKRFTNLVEEDAGKVYYSSRGMFVQAALTDLIWQTPVGNGLGNWGMINENFGTPRPDAYWVEVMIPAWIVDGGFPLILLYAVALAVAMLDTFRIALKSRDPDLRYWAALIFSMNMGVLATCFSYVSFLAPLGLPFWVFSAAIHDADRISRANSPTRPKGRPLPARPRPEPLVP
jgi:hypothetical protein